MKEKTIYLLSAGMAAAAILLLQFFPGRQPDGQSGKADAASFAERLYVNAASGGAEAALSGNSRPETLFLPGRGHAVAEDSGPVSAEKSESKLQLLGIFQYGSVRGAIIEGVAPVPGRKGLPPKVFKVGDVVDKGLLLTDIQERKAILSSASGRVTLDLKKTAAAGGGNAKP